MLVGCGQGEKNPQLSFTIDEAIGGYEMETESLHCIYIVDGEHEYVRFESKTDLHTIEYYADSGSIMVIDRNIAGTTYYIEELEDTQAVFENPLIAIYNSWKENEFELTETQENGLNIFQTVKVTETLDQEQVDYTKYEIHMTWSDAKEYTFYYYEYADDASLISAEAPNEINPLLDAKTPWKVDVNKSVIRNVNTNEEVAFQIIGTQTGKALSPSGETTIKEEKTYIYLTVNQESGEIEKVQFSTDGKTMGQTFNLLHEGTISKPEITKEMSQMSDEILQLAFMIINTVKGLL